MVHLQTRIVFLKHLGGETISSQVNFMALTAALLYDGLATGGMTQAPIEYSDEDAKPGHPF